MHDTQFSKSYKGWQKVQPFHKLEYNSTLVRFQKNANRARAFMGNFHCVVQRVSVLWRSICIALFTTWKRISKMSTLPPWKNICGRPWLQIHSWFFSHGTWHTVISSHCLLHYLSRCLWWVWSTVTCGKTSITVHLKWSFEDVRPCYCYTIKTNSRSIRSQVMQPASAGKGAEMCEVQLQAHHCICMAPEQWNWLLCSVSVISAKVKFLVLCANFRGEVFVFYPPAEAHGSITLVAFA